MTPTKNTEPDFKTDSVCDILKACKKLNVKRVVLNGCEIEFYPETPEPEPVQSGFSLPVDRMGENIQKAHIAELEQQRLREAYEAQELANARQQFENKRVTPSDNTEIQRMVEEQDLMLHHPTAWEDQQIDALVDNGKDREPDFDRNESPAYRAFASKREEGVQ